MIGVADRTGGIVNENGLDVPALRHHIKARPPFGGTLRTFPGGAHRGNELGCALLRDGISCDIGLLHAYFPCMAFRLLFYSQELVLAVSGRTRACSTELLPSGLTMPSALALYGRLLFCCPGLLTAVI